MTTGDGHAVASGQEIAWVVGVFLGAIGLFLTTFSSAVALGDAPESVSGIRSVGILHAPGYPSFVLLGRLWATLLPIGSWSQRVNLFSLLCAAGAVAFIFVLARQFAAERGPAAIGAFAVATSVSFWFNAGFAKHYGLSALLVTLLAVLVVSWERHGGRARLFGAGAVLGLGFGASWELTAIMALGLGGLVLAGSRRVCARDFVPAFAIAALGALGTLVFVVVRAGQHPAVNWGGATSAGRLVDLLRQKDFITGAAAPNGVRAFPQAPHRLASYGSITVHEVGAAAIVIALIGAVVVIRRKRWGDTLFFGVVALGNVAGVVFVAGLTTSNGIAAGMVVGGFLIDLVIVIGVLVAVGATSMSNTLASWVANRRGDAPAGASRGLRALVCTLIAFAVLLPSAVVHEPYATHRGPALADLYARRVFSALPTNAVLVVWGAEFAQPMRYLQIVRGERRDVAIFSGAESPLPWYRDELQRDFPEIAPASNLAPNDYVLQFVNNAAAKGPVFVDMSAIGQFSQTTSGFRLDGLVAQFTAGQALTVSQPLADLSRSLDAAQKADGWTGGVGRLFPNQPTSLLEVRANLFLASFYTASGDFPGAAARLRQAIKLRPDNPSLRDLLQLALASDPRTHASILQIAEAR